MVFKLGSHCEHCCGCVVNIRMLRFLSLRFFFRFREAFRVCIFNKSLGKFSEEESWKTTHRGGRTEGKPHLSTRQIGMLCCLADFRINCSRQMRTRIYARLFTQMSTYRHYRLWFPKHIESDLFQIPICGIWEVSRSDM